MVSIIVPVYNCEKYLKKCIESLIHQTCKDIEIVLVDDGSTDNSKNICISYAVKDSRIKLISQKNQGPSRARNVGLENSKGEYILFVDSDDWLDLSTVELCIEKIKEYNPQIVCFDYYKVSNGEKRFCNLFDDKEKLFSGEEIIELRNLLYASELELESDILALAGICCKVYKKEILKNIFFNEKLKLGEDWLFILQAIKKADSLLYIKNNLYYRRERSNSLSGCKSREYIKRRVRLMNIMLSDEDVPYEYRNRSCFNGLCTVAEVAISDKDISYRKRKELIRLFLRKIEFHYDFKEIDYKCKNKNFQCVRFLVKYRLYFGLMILVELIKIRNNIKCNRYMEDGEN